MIAIFTVAGFGLLSGGLYAIYSGWPYLVLERGFTQVIVGTVAATGGLLMLSLAYVLKELKGVRRDLAEAAAPAYAGEAAMPPAISAAMPPPVLPAETPHRSDLAPALGAAAAAAGGAIAAAWPKAEESAEAKPPAGVADRDLFGAPIAEAVSEEAAANSDEAEPEHGAELSHAVPDLFAPSKDGKADADAAALADEDYEPAEIVAARVQPLSQDEALAKSDSADVEPVETGFANRESEPEVEAEPVVNGEPAEPALPSPAPTPENDAGSLEQTAEDEPAPSEAPDAMPEPEIDEFRALRESLTSELGYPASASRRLEPSVGLDTPAFPRDESLFPGSGRREPSFAPAEPEPEADAPAEEVVLPIWPPRTGTLALDDTAAAPAEDTDAPAQPVAEEPVAAEPAGEPEAPPSEERPSSDEGIVGAYQVGDAHFTIFADGSIRARTPDGEYSFASMDELKVYLASEKSRLGV